MEMEVAIARLLLNSRLLLLLKRNKHFLGGCRLELADKTLSLYVRFFFEDDRELYLTHFCLS